MQLYLVQHALATSKEENPGRPLSAEGESTARRMAEFAAAHLRVGPGAIYHSGKLRAKQTAELFAEHLKPKGGVEEVEGMSPMDEPTLIAEKLESMGDNPMLVGHLPHLSRLAAHLVGGKSGETIVGFHNAGIVCLGRDEGAGWVLLWAVTPGSLK